MIGLERVVAFLGGVAGILAAVDAYFFKSKLAEALSLPPSLPTGITAIVVAVASFVVFFAARRISALERKVGELGEQRHVLALAFDSKQAELLSLEAKLVAVETHVKELRAAATNPSDLENRVYAVLVRKEASPREIVSELQLDSSELQNVIGAIASLVQANKIEGGSLSTNYRIRQS